MTEVEQILTRLAETERRFREEIGALRSEAVRRLGFQQLTSFDSKTTIVVGGDESAEIRRLTRGIGWGEGTKQRISIELQKRVEKELEPLRKAIRKLFVRNNERYVKVTIGGKTETIPLDSAIGIALASLDAEHSDVLTAGEVDVWIKTIRGKRKYITPENISKDEQAAIFTLVDSDPVGRGIMKAYAKLDERMAELREAA